MITLMKLVVSFPLHGSLPDISAKFTPVERKILFSLSRCKASKGNMWAAVKVVNNLRKYFLELSTIVDMHPVEIIVFDDLVVGFDQGIGIMNINQGPLVFNGIR